jgi:KH domain-containing protein
MLSIKNKMVQEIYTPNLKEILRSKSRFEKDLNIKLSNKGHNIFVEGSPEREFIAMEVLEAINLGFSADRALELNQDDFMLQTVHIKDLTKRQDLERIRARIVGTKGKTLKTLNNLTKCDLSVYNNEIGIIGPADEIENAVQAITSIIQGSKQSNVYSRLERLRKKKKLIDQGWELKVKKE